MKPKLLLVFYPLIMQSAVTGQNYYWAVPADSSGMRNGTWDTAAPGWNMTSSNQPPVLPWANTGSGTANFSGRGGTIIATTGIVASRINSSSKQFELIGTPITLIGNYPAVSGSITVSGGLVVPAGTLKLNGSGAIVINSRIQANAISSTSNIRFTGGTLGSTTSLKSTGSITFTGDETISSYSGTANLSGSGSLAAINGFDFQGGDISTSIIGTINSTGQLTITGTTSGGELNVNSGFVYHGGTSRNDTVNIKAGGNFAIWHTGKDLDEAVRGLDPSATVNNQGVLRVDYDDTIARYQQNGGQLTGPQKLIVTAGADLNGGTVSGKLDGNITTTGNVLVTGTLGGGSLSVGSGSLDLKGASTNPLVEISPVSSMIVSNGALDAAADVSNYGLLTVNTDDTVSTYTQKLGKFWRGENPTDRPFVVLPGSGDTVGGALRGTGTLTATNGAFLEYGIVEGNLIAPQVRVSGSSRVWGTLSGDKLSIGYLGNLQVVGSCSFHEIDISQGGWLSVEGELRQTPDVVNAGVLDSGGMHTVASLTNNGGWVMGGLTVLGEAVFNGGHIEYGPFVASSGVTLNDGTSVNGNLVGNTTSHGRVDAAGNLSGGDLYVGSGTFTLTGESTNPTIRIAPGASFRSSGNIGDTSHISNSGTVSIDTGDTVGSLINEAGLVNGSGHLRITGATVFNGGELACKLDADSGAVLNNGTVISGELTGAATTHGNVLISGKIGGGIVNIESGSLTLTGTADAFLQIRQGISLFGNGRINGDVLNDGTLATLPEGDRTLEISGSLATRGILSLSLTSATAFDRIKVGAIAALDGDLLVTNLGTGLEAGAMARIIEADSYLGTFDSFATIGFRNGVLFDETTGRLIGMAGGSPGSSKHYLNLNSSQTQVYLSLYEDSVDAGFQNVTTAGASAAKKAARTAGGTGASGDAVEFTSGLSDGDADLVHALNLATFTDPGSIYQPVINQLSPEVHRGMADYTEQAVRSHVREAVEAAPVSRSGNTQLFATVHSSSEGVDSTATNAGYDLQMSGFTTGVRYDIDKRTRIGGLLGADDGSIEGALIDTDGRGITAGVFGSYLIEEAHGTLLTASLARGACNFDAERHSFLGAVNADDIGSRAVELTLGVRADVLVKNGLRVTPNATLRYLDGSVDGFTEHGSGVPLGVGSQDIGSFMLDLGVDVEYRLPYQITLAGSLGYVTDFRDSSNTVDGAFAASGTAARPFHVSAPGIDDDAVVLGLGAYYDINETMRVSLTYRGDFRFGSQDAYTLGIGASFGF